jgi:hypothetical protein
MPMPTKQELDQIKGKLGVVETQINLSQEQYMTQEARASVLRAALKELGFAHDRLDKLVNKTPD